VDDDVLNELDEGEYEWFDLKDNNNYFIMHATKNIHKE
jgi:hypothetical protein